MMKEGNNNLGSDGKEGSSKEGNPNSHSPCIVNKVFVNDIKLILI